MSSNLDSKLRYELPKKMKWKIGNVEIPNRFVLAPMAGVTDLAFRRLCKEQGWASLHGDDQCQGYFL